MVRFIYLCMGILFLSMVAVPIYFGVSKEHKNIQVSANTPADEQDTSLSFEEIYALADEGQETTPESLGNIAPAAGAETTPDSFSSGFNKREDSALADTPVEIEPEAQTTETDAL